LSGCDAKRESARGAIELLREHAPVRVLGVGTGSTVARFIELLGAGLLGELGVRMVVPSSLDTALRLARLGVPVAHPAVVDSVDAYVDGADEVAPGGGLLKGRGAALLGEKILAGASNLNIIVVTGEKLVERLGSRRPVPVEVVRDALGAALRMLSSRWPGAAPRPAGGKDGPVVSDWGGVIVDVPTGPLGDPWEAEAWMLRVPGVVETGLFLGYTDYVVVGSGGCGWRVERYER